MAFTIGSRPSSRASGPATPSSSSSGMNVPSGISSLLPSISRRGRSPADERTSLLQSTSERQSSRGPRRSWTADLDAVNNTPEGSTGAGGGGQDTPNTVAGTGKRDDEDQSVISRDFGRASPSASYFWWRYKTDERSWEHR